MTQENDPGHPDARSSGFAAPRSTAAYAELDSVDEPFLRDVAAALVAAGRDVALDAGLATVEVDAQDPSIGTLLGVVRPLARSVTCYAVYPRRVASEAWPQLLERAVRATDAEFDAAIEVDLTTGAVAARCSLALGAVDIGSAALGGLLGVAFEEAEAALLRYGEAIAAVAAGEVTAAEAMALARQAEREALEEAFTDISDPGVSPSDS